MAYTCPNCRLATNKKYSNCPGCAGALFEDNHSAEELEALGYRFLGKTRAVPPSDPSQNILVTRNHISDDDILKRLRDGYRESRNASAETGPEKEDPGMNPPPVDSRDFFGSYSNTVRQPQSRRTDDPSQSDRPREHSGTGNDTDQPDDFFAHYAAGSRAGDQSAQAQPGRTAAQEEVPPIQPEPLQPHSGGFHLDLSGLGYTLGSILRAIPWRAVFLLVIIGLFIGGIMTLWSLRYEIVNAVLGFAVELMPLALIIGGIYYLVRSVFR